MARRRATVLIRPELDDRELHRALREIRPTHQLHGLGADRTGIAWRPVAELLRVTGADWDRRAHRVSVLAPVLPPAVADRWAAQCPDDHDAVVVRACVRATRARTGTEAAVETARASCVEAAGRYPEDPTPWLALLGLLRSRDAPLREAVPVWREIAARDRWSRAAHHEVLRYLSPRSHGSVFDMMGFAWRAASHAPHDSPLVVLPLTARAEHFAHRLNVGGRDALSANRLWHDPTAAREIETALHHWFHPAPTPHAEVVADLNVLAFALVRARLLPEAGQVFRRIGRDMTPFPWNSLDDPERAFTYWRDRSASSADA
ncbi:hypothetical protein ACFVT5_32520 [Streptomyces sp. NPDC058001]|uniref:hypothetical protein n=1 Tax=Streptomyces sp. NPDC058001 TaxID=3346300 RepID=UPI0036F0C075